MNQRLLLNLKIAFDAILANKIRSLLTALGIIFGVAAVIAMLAIGNGARQEILEQIKLVGVNNIVVTPIIEQSEENISEASEKTNEKKRFSPGLSLQDMQSAIAILPNIETLSPEIIFETDFVRGGLKRSGKLVGINPSYFSISNFKLLEGNHFNEKQMNYGEQVCIIGKSVATKFFSKEVAIGKYIKCGPAWFKVIGVLEERIISKNAIQNLGIRDYNMDVYIPVKTMLIRVKNRTLITKSKLEMASMNDDDENNNIKEKDKNYHQIDRLVIQVKETQELQATADVISRMLNRRHNGKVDYEISIPEMLLKQQQRTKDIFNLVLGAIAGISLLVGGIGIMNIMLASVMERIKEIGLRLSIGAKKQDIIQQFLLEAVLISLTGGLAGILLGVIFSYIASILADIETIISLWSILISFGVSFLTGLVFGIAPARRAAEQDPIKSLRYE